MPRVQLVRLAHARSGDKGDTVNVGVIAYDPAHYELLRGALTPERVKAHFGPMVKGGVERFELSNLHALNFLLHGALGGGGTRSLMNDAQGKVFSTALLRMEIEVEPEVAAAVEGRGRVPEAVGALAREVGRPPGEPGGSAGSRAGGGPTLRYDVEDGVATLLMNRPEKRNALNGELLRALSAGLVRAREEASVRVVVIRGAGRDFCAGMDLASLERISELGPEANLADAAELGELFIRIRRMSKPVVAVVQGRALAGGCGLATACDLLLAHEDARLGYPEVRIGFVPAMVMSILKRKVPEALAFELVALGNPIPATEAARIGLVNKVFPEESFGEGVSGYVAELASRPPSALALSKRLFYGLRGTGFEDGIARAAEVNALARLTEACRKGVREFLGGKKRS